MKRAMKKAVGGGGGCCSGWWGAAWRGARLQSTSRSLKLSCCCCSWKLKQLKLQLWGSWSSDAGRLREGGPLEALLFSHTRLFILLSLPPSKPFLEDAFSAAAE